MITKTQRMMEMFNGELNKEDKTSLKESAVLKEGVSLNEVKDDYKRCYGKELNEKDVPYVMARDKMLSGWGGAEGKSHYQIVVCGNSQEAANIESSMKSSAKKEGLSNIRRGFGLPKTSNKSVSFIAGKDAKAWNTLTDDWYERNFGEKADKKESVISKIKALQEKCSMKESDTMSNVETVHFNIEFCDDIESIQYCIYDIEDGALEDEVQRTYDQCIADGDSLDDVKSLVIQTLEDNAEYEDMDEGVTLTERDNSPSGTYKRISNALAEMELVYEIFENADDDDTWKNNAANLVSQLQDFKQEFNNEFLGGLEEGANLEEKINKDNLEINRAIANVTRGNNAQRVKDAGYDVDRDFIKNLKTGKSVWLGHYDKDERNKVDFKGKLDSERENKFKTSRDSYDVEEDKIPKSLKVGKRNNRSMYNEDDIASYSPSFRGNPKKSISKNVNDYKTAVKDSKENKNLANSWRKDADRARERMSDIQKDIDRYEGYVKDSEQKSANAEAKRKEILQNARNRRK